MRRYRSCIRILQMFLIVMTLTQVASAEPTKVVFMFRAGGELQKQVIEAWKTGFEAKNPDLTIEWQIPASDWMTKLPVLVATGMGPDVYESWGVNGLNWGQTGVSLDLTPYIKRDFTARDIQDFYPASWASTEITYGPKKGVRYGLPSNGNVYMMYHNKDMFAESGLPYLTDLDKQDNWTWDSLLTIGKKLTRFDGEKVTRWALDSDDLYAPTGRGAGWVYAAGGQYFDLPNNPTKFVGNQPEAIKALTFMQDLIWKHRLMSPLPTRGDARWNLGKSAILMWQGSANLTSLEQTITTFDWDLGPRPMGPKSRGYVMSADMFAINAESKNKEAAWRFLKYLTSKEGQEIYSKVFGRGPTRRSAFPYFQSLFPKRSTMYITLGMMEGGLGPETFIPKAANDLILNAIRNEIATNNKNPRQAMDEIADAVNAAMQQ